MNEKEWYKINLEKLTESHTIELSERRAGEQKARIKVFLQELTSLCEKYDIYIKGCGCCGSPWIEDFKTGKQYDNLTITENGYETDD